MNLKKFQMGLFSVIFVLSFLMSTVFVSAQDDFCGVKAGSYMTCNNNLSDTSELAYYKNKKADYVEAPDAYSIKFVSSKWTPDVRRGDPIYKNFYIYSPHDKKTIYNTSDHSGKHLLDYSSLSVGPNKKAGYYPDKNPQTFLVIQNAPPVACNSQPWDCSSMEQASEFYIK
ncbi:hypothetical protein [Brevibacillus sp. FIR094]|uniref:hypothetical protein n=1 Tax=Brevibacillus sp. FIR094 TaxID=3134809 RepID=UPI003D1D2938